VVIKGESRFARSANHRRVILSRHRKSNSATTRRIISGTAAAVRRQWESQGKRGRIIIAGTAAALTVGTTASAAAAVWPAGVGAKAAPAHPAQTRLVNSQQDIIAFQQARSAVNRRAEQEQALAAQRAAAAKKAAAAAQRSAAAKKAAEATALKAAAAKAAAKKTAQLQASGTPQQIAEALLGSYGWSTSQFSCLDSLWTRESNWDVTVSNASSGAYGIPQALPGSKMASAGPDWATSATTQIKWGLSYIRPPTAHPAAPGVMKSQPAGTRPRGHPREPAARYPAS
jgi:hypothetical protein